MNHDLPYHTVSSFTPYIAASWAIAAICVLWLLIGGYVRLRRARRELEAFEERKEKA